MDRFDYWCRGLLCISVLMGAAVPAHATFHNMQIEQLILGVNGDASAQAVQLRMRADNENHTEDASLWVYDQFGFNKTALVDQFPHRVTNATVGARILIATPAFALHTTTPLVADFVMDPVPPSFLSAGRITFENYIATLVFWGFAYGGDAYLGPTTGTENDDDGDFGVFPIALPTDGIDSARFQGPPTALSTTNAADYIIAPGQTVWTNNAGQQFTVSPDANPVRRWGHTSSGDWNAALNWMEGQVPNDSNRIAAFGDVIPLVSTVFTNTPVTVQGIEFDSSRSYGIAGTGLLILESNAGNAFIDVVRGSHQILLPVRLSDDTDIDLTSGAFLAFNNTLNLDGKTLTKTGSGGLFINGKVISGGGNIAASAGTISGSGEILADLTNTGATIAPGNSPGILTIGGDYDQGIAGVLAIELGGKIAGTVHDRLEVSGVASLNGTILVDLIDGFRPKAGDVFDVLTAASILDNGFVLAISNFDRALVAPRIVELAGGDQALRLFIVPESASAISMLIAFAALLMRRFRLLQDKLVSQKSAAIVLAGTAVSICLGSFAHVSTEAATWNLNGSGTWNSPAHWDVMAVPNSNQTAVIFGDQIDSPQTVVVDSAFTVKSITFDSPHTYAVAGLGILVLNTASGAATLEAAQGAHDFQVPVSLQANTNVSVASASNITFHNRLSLNNRTMTIMPGSRVNIEFAPPSTVTTGTIANAGILGSGSFSAINGSLNNTGALHFEIGHNGASEFGRFNVAGTANLSGTLDIDLVNGFALSGSESFTVLTASAINNNGISLSTSAAALFKLATVGNSLVLNARYPGDYNDNGDVDAADYVMWRNTLGSTTDLRADGNNSGTVDPADYSFWKNRFGSSRPGAASSSEFNLAPEPTSAALILVSSVVTIIRLRSSRRV